MGRTDKRDSVRCEERDSGGSEYWDWGLRFVLKLDLGLVRDAGLSSVRESGLRSVLHSGLSSVRDSGSVLVLNLYGPINPDKERLSEFSKEELLWLRAKSKPRCADSDDLDLSTSNIVTPLADAAAYVISAVSSPPLYSPSPPPSPPPPPPPLPSSSVSMREAKDLLDVCSKEHF